LKNITDVNMDLACSMASISHGKRLQVGAVLVTANDVVLRGVNGLPKPLGNELEGGVTTGDDSNGTASLVTKPTVIHAELNCILKAAREGVIVVGSTLFVTHSPCQACASMLVAAGVAKVYYHQDYRDTDGVKVLKMCGVEVVQLERMSDGLWKIKGEEG